MCCHILVTGLLKKALIFCDWIAEKGTNDQLSVQCAEYQILHVSEQTR